MNLESYELDIPCANSFTPKIMTDSYTITYNSPSTLIFKSYEDIFDHSAKNDCPLDETGVTLPTACKLLDAGCNIFSEFIG